MINLFVIGRDECLTRDAPVCHGLSAAERAANITNRKEIHKHPQAFDVLLNRHGDSQADRTRFGKPVPGCRRHHGQINRQINTDQNQNAVSIKVIFTDSRHRAFGIDSIQFDGSHEIYR
ncbi:hypothetical protein [Burkholderia ubonensis]|uniref:hypothetical protein n=1 Tax=Burkholderia ubonensis TaxID=101571 RepID=UPI0012F75C14|nr:hypothetical protein [Burkholderia ubonensis]